VRRAWILATFATTLAACSTEEAEPTQVAALAPAAPASAATTTSRATDRFPTPKGDLVVTPLEHASVLFGWNGKAIYVDPTSTAINDAALPKADIVFVTDARAGHLDEVALSRVRTAATVIVAPASVAARTHVDVVLRNGDARDVQGIGVQAVPMYSLKRGPGPGLLFQEKGHGNGYVLDFAGERVYLSGDTECTPEVAALDRIDVAFVAIEPPYTMSPEEAAVCLEAFKPRVVFPYRHLGTDLAAIDRALAGTGIDVRERSFYPRPDGYRREAFESCDGGHWGRCEELLDRAKLLDPAGEKDARVVRAREEARTHTHLGPAAPPTGAP
jgi:L-ascorbate metabolism protein UlaG (beta-lactamase superfamily)